MKKPPNKALEAFYKVELCPIRAVLSQIGDKWSLLIITHLTFGSHRFSELKTAIPDISQRMLTQNLRKLEREGLVLRTVTPTIPPRVDYELTELGKSLLTPLAGLSDWALHIRPEIEQARIAFDERASHLSS